MNIRLEIDKLRSLGFFKHYEDKEEYYLCTCPFHKGGNEKTPSFGINKQKMQIKGGTQIDEGYCHCFGCGYKGRFTELLADLYGTSEINILKRELKDKIYQDKRDFNIVFGDEDIEEFIYKPLPISQKTREYLHKRKITDDVIKEFEISSDAFDSVVFPLKDKRGNVIAIQKRSIVDKKFFNTKHFDKMGFIYGLYEVKSSQDEFTEVFVCESVIDALTVKGFGYQAVALMGSSISKYHIKELCKLKQEIIIATDNDEVGKKAYMELANGLKKYGKRFKKFRWINEVEKDINDLTLEKFIKIKVRI